jgi:glycosyltransferase involved in cell wall biosynthesis
MYSLRKIPSIEFKLMVPCIRLLQQGGKVKRLVLAFLNYMVVMIQELFVRADLFWVANCPDVLVLPLILRRKRYILDYRSPWPIEVAQELGNGPWVPLTELFERLALKHAWLITLTTSKLLDRVKRYGKLIFVIPNYPLRKFGENVIKREDFRRLFGYGPNDKVVLFVGKLSRVEGADLLPKIVEEVIKKDSSVVFWIVGDGPYYKELKSLEEKYGKNVKLFGWQPYSRIPSFIEASDVCIVPRHKSVFSMFYNEEGLHKISEYTFFEKPIVACGIAESDEYLLVDQDEVADAILRALRGEAPKPKRKTWEDHSEKTIFEIFSKYLA